MTNIDNKYNKMNTTNGTFDSQSRFDHQILDGIHVAAACLC